MANDVVLRIDRNRNYKTIGLEAVADRRLSWKAKGLHTYLITRPDGWNFNVRDVIQRAKDGRQAVQSGLQELEAFGYLERRRDRDDGGQFSGWLWIIREYAPADDDTDTDSPKTRESVDDSTDERETRLSVDDRRTGFPTSGKPSDGKPVRIVVKEGSTTPPPAPPVEGRSAADAAGRSPTVENSRSSGGPVSAGDALRDMAGDGDPVHEARTSLFDDVRRWGWLGPDPPDGVSRAHEAKILGELVRVHGEGEILLALEGARRFLESKDAGDLPYSLRLLAARAPGGRSLCSIFAARQRDDTNGRVSDGVLEAIRAAMRGAEHTPS
ncbi:MAG: hypothetical protein ACODAA_08400 [Gemmatimonadota bacterium]